MTLLLILKLWGYDERGSMKTESVTIKSQGKAPFYAFLYSDVPAPLPLTAEVAEQFEECYAILWREAGMVVPWKEGQTIKQAILEWAKEAL